MKGFPYRNVSQGAEGSGCAGEGLGKNSSLWQLKKKVSNAKLFPNGLCRSHFGACASFHFCKIQSFAVSVTDCVSLNLD